MWTAANRENYSRETTRYQSDVTDEEWRIIASARAFLYAASIMLLSRRIARAVWVSGGCLEGNACDLALILSDIECPTTIDLGMRVHQIMDDCAGKRERIAVVAQIHDPEVFGLGVFGTCNELEVGHLPPLSEVPAPRCSKLHTDSKESRP
jgi:hypothetical protein